MEREVVITRRFMNNTAAVYYYILKEFSPKTAFEFIEKLEKRIAFIKIHPEAGKLSQKRKNVRSIPLVPHNRIYYRYQSTKIEILSLFDMRKDPSKRPY